MNSEAVGALYWDLKDRKKNQGLVRKKLYQSLTQKSLKGASKTFVEEEFYTDLEHKLEERLRFILSEILAGNFALLPQKCSGRRCTYFEICRYDDKSRS